MLTLSRFVGEKIIIDYHGSLIEVMVIEIIRGRVRLGILAPKEIAVHRREIQDRIDARYGEAKP